MTFIQRNLLSILTLLAMVVISMVLYQHLPQQVPSRYNTAGELIATQSRALIVVLMPLMYTLMIILVNVMIRISPQKFAMPNSQRAMDMIVFASGVLMLFTHLGLLLGTDGILAFTRYFAYGVAGFLIIAGNVFGNTERNFFIGIRLPWTIASSANWKATHRVAGKVMVVAGLLMLVSNTLAPHFYLTMTTLLVAVFIPVFYSLYYYLRYEKGAGKQ